MLPSTVEQLISALIVSSVLLLAGPAPDASAAEPSPSLRVPSHVPPVTSVWGWGEKDFGPDAYKPHIDMMAHHSGVNLLATTIRAPAKLVTDPAVREQIRQATQYASRFGIGIVMDLDLRLAREAFRAAHPGELQEMLRLREVALKASGEAMLSIASNDLTDHYTYLATHYIPLSGSLVRAYAYERDAQGIKPDTIREITPSCRVTTAGAQAVSVSIPCDPGTQGKTACVMVSFTHLAADVFAPHLLPFQREILESYRGVPLAGACKDEWGFPPCFDGNPAHDDYWYSRFLAKAYSQQTRGHDLLRDCLLMTYGEVGREASRAAAINQFNELCRQRNGAIEQDFYDAVKSVWGRDAAVMTHPTWWPYPDRREFKKNGLDWWIVRRDWAQTDEIAPYCVRTALAKKWNSPVWINMYYSADLPDYQAEMWAGALSGGRIDYHPLWPPKNPAPPLENERYGALLRGGLMRGDCRIRLLNFITASPLDCPVAVVFGQPCAMNWAGPAYDDVGLTLTDALWRAGYPADLIPTTEIWTGALAISDDGYIHYGRQRYQSVVLYHPQFDRPTTADFFRKAATQAAKGKSKLYRIGNWTHSFDGQPFDALNPGSVHSLPEAMTVLSEVREAPEPLVHDPLVREPRDSHLASSPAERRRLERRAQRREEKAGQVLFPQSGPAGAAGTIESVALLTAVNRITKELTAAGIEAQSPATRTIGFADCRSVAPPAEGECRLTDGTHIIVSGVKSAAGDPIQRTIQVQDHSVTVDAIGLFAIRLDKEGHLEALAAGGLKSFIAGDLKIDLPERIDIALWRDEKGQLHGVLQDGPAEIPAPLSEFTDDWLRLSAPIPLE